MGKGVRENTLFFILFQRPTHFYLKKIGFNGEDRKRDEKKNGLLATRHKDKKGKSRYYLYGSSASPPVNGDTGHIRQWETDNSKQNIIII
jgi:hypothetical protein